MLLENLVNVSLKVAPQSWSKILIFTVYSKEGAWSACQLASHSIKTRRRNKAWCQHDKTALPPLNERREGGLSHFMGSVVWKLAYILVAMPQKSWLPSLSFFFFFKFLGHDHWLMPHSSKIPCRHHQISSKACEPLEMSFKTCTENWHGVVVFQVEVPHHLR